MPTRLSLLFLAGLLIAGCSKEHEIRLAKAQAELAEVEAELSEARAQTEAANIENAKLKSQLQQLAASSTPPVQPAPQSAEDDPHRRAAAWALQHGATLKLVDAQFVAERTNLPADFQIEEIRFPENQKSVTDEGLAVVALLTTLKALHVRGSNISDRGLEHVRNLPGLTGLNLHATQVTDEGLAHLADLTGLTSLDLGYNRQITDSGLAHLAKLAKLETLNIYATDVGDEGLVTLAALTSLRHLQLHGTKVTAAGLPHLEKLSSLRTLVLPKEIDPEAVEKLRQALPDCTITTG